MNKTLECYNEIAKIFYEGTYTIDFSVMQNLFVKNLPTNAYILDFGCGSGRDSKSFIKLGYRVDAMDGSEELCKLASENIGQPVIHKLFSELDDTEKYDGIWACASILHLTKTKLKDVLYKMIKALKPDGYIYASFKYGNYEGMRGDRYFIYMTEISFDELLKDFSNIEIVYTMVTEDVREDRKDERWLNLILRKCFPNQI